MTEVSIIGAFITGLLTFFAPCTFATIPLFLGYLSNQATDKDNLKDGTYRLRLIGGALAYVLSFLLVFTLLGFTATSFGLFLARNQFEFLRVAAVIIILFGVFMLIGDKLKPFKFMLSQKQFKINPHRFDNTIYFPIVLGLTSAFAWSPCIGPVLGGILALAGTTSESAGYGALLLFVYGLGINVPFILLAIFFGHAKEFVQKFSKYTGIIHKITAALMILIGIMLLTNWWGYFYNFLLEIFIFIGYQPY